MTVLVPLYLTKVGVTAALDRGLLADIFTPGVPDKNSLVVTSTGGARSVNVSSGSCFVPGNQAGGQGTYRVYNDSSLTLTHAAATTFPRVDQIMARVYDSDYSGALDQGAIEILQGVETNGATLDNRGGAIPDGSLGTNFLRIADVLVPVGASPVIPAGNIRDRRPFASFRGGGQLPIGAQVPYVATVDPGDGMWIMADGRLIDKTTYSTFAGRAQNSYNGGVDPGSNKVRVPDKRGRSPIGAVSFGTDGLNGVTAVGNINSRYQGILGSNGGEVNHLLTSPESGLRDHAHQEIAASGGAGIVNGMALNTGSASIFGSVQDTGGVKTVDSVNGRNGVQDALNSHNTIHPFEADYWLVRIA